MDYNNSKQYYVQLPGAQQGMMVDASKFEQGKDRLYKEHPDAIVTEMSGYTGQEQDIDRNTRYHVQLPGAAEGMDIDYDKFHAGKDRLFKEHPDAQVTVMRKYDMRPGNAQAADTLIQDAMPSDIKSISESALNAQTAYRDFMGSEDNRFLEDYEERRRKYYSPNGGAMNSASIDIAEGEYLRGNKEKARELKAQRDKLSKEYYNNPEFLEMRKKQADENMVRAKVAHMRGETYRKENDQKKATSYPGMSGLPAYNVGDRAAREYDRAEKLYRDASDIYRAPSKYGDELGLMNYAKGMGSQLTNQDFWTRGLSELNRNNDLRRIQEKLQQATEGDRNVTEDDIDKALDPSEKELLKAYYTYMSAQQMRANDLSMGYSAGQSAVESLGFMAEFAMTGAVRSVAGKALSKGTSAVAKWLGRELGVSVLDESAKGVAAMAARTAGMGKGSRVAYQYFSKPVMEAVTHTLLQPGAYRTISQNLLETNDMGELVSRGEAIRKGLLDGMIENWSESMGGGVEWMLGSPFKLGDKLVGSVKLGNVQVRDMVRWINDNDLMSTMRKAGWNGFIGEIGEEYLGAAARLSTGLMTGKEFNEQMWKGEDGSWSGPLEMMASFGLMSGISLMGESKAVISKRREYKRMLPQMQDVMHRMGVSDDEIDALFHTPFSTMEDVAKAIAPYYQRTVENSRNDASLQAANDERTVLRFAKAVGEDMVANEVERLQQEQARGKKLADINAEMQDQQFWMDGEDGQTIRRITKDGKVGYIVGGTEDNWNVSYSDGSKGFISESEIQQGLEDGTIEDTGLRQRDEFLDYSLEEDRKAAENARMRTEQMVADGEVQSQIQQGSTINIGTVEKPNWRTVISTTPNNIVVDMGDGTYNAYSWHDAAEFVGIDNSPKTDEQIDEEEANVEQNQEQIRQTIAGAARSGLTVTHDGQQFNLTSAVEWQTDEETGESTLRCYATDALGRDVEISLTSDEVAQAMATVDANKAKDTATDMQETPQQENVENTDSTPEAVTLDAKYIQEDGSVNQDLLWNEQPELWARWNDQQRGDGGANSAEWIRNSLASLDKQIAEATEAYNNATLNERQAIEGGLQSLNERRSVIESLFGNYDRTEQNAPQQEEETQQAEDTAETPEQQEVENTEAASEAPAGYAEFESKYGENTGKKVQLGVQAAQKDLEKANGELAKLQEEYDNAAPGSKEEAKLEKDIAKKQEEIAGIQQRLEQFSSYKQHYDAVNAERVARHIEELENEAKDAETLQQVYDAHIAARPQVEGFSDIDSRLGNMVEEMGFEEQVAYQAAKSKYIWGDNDNGTKGLGSHVVATGGSKESERRKHIGWIAGKDKGGAYPEVVAERIFADLPDYVKEGHDPMEALDIILDVISSSTSPSDAIRKQHDRIVTTQRDLEQQEEDYAKHQFATEQGFANYDDYTTFNELIKSVEYFENQFTEEEKDEIYSILAQEYESGTEGSTGTGVQGVVQSADKQGTDNEGSPGLGGEQTSDIEERDNGGAQEGQGGVHGAVETRSNNVVAGSAEEAEQQPAVVDGQQVPAERSILEQDGPTYMERGTTLYYRQDNPGSPYFRHTDETRQRMRKAATDMIPADTGIAVHVYDSYEQAPSDIADLASKADADAFAYNGALYVFLDRVPSRQRMMQKMLHEGATHIGMRRMLGEERYNELCDRVWDMMEDADKRYLEETKGYRKLYKDKMSEQQYQRALADEYMAYLSEKLVGVPDNQHEKTILEKIADFIRKVFGIEKKDLGLEDVLNLLQASYANIQNNGAARQIREGESLEQFAERAASEDRQFQNADEQKAKADKVLEKLGLKEENSPVDTLELPEGVKLKRINSVIYEILDNDAANNAINLYIEDDGGLYIRVAGNGFKKFADAFGYKYERGGTMLRPGVYVPINGNNFSEAYERAKSAVDGTWKKDAPSDKLQGRINVDGVNVKYVVAGEYYDNDKLRKLAHGVKDGDEESIAEAAKILSKLIPSNAIVIPIPSHNGEVSDGMSKLCDKIAEKKSSVGIAKILHGKQRESIYEAKKQGKTLDAEDLAMTSDLNYDGVNSSNTPIVFLDNVIATGRTAAAAMKAAGSGTLVALAVDSKASSNAETSKNEDNRFVLTEEQKNELMDFAKQHPTWDAVTLIRLGGFLFDYDNIVKNNPEFLDKLKDVSTKAYEAYKKRVAGIPKPRLYVDAIENDDKPAQDKYISDFTSRLQALIPDDIAMLEATITSLKNAAKVKDASEAVKQAYPELIKVVKKRIGELKKQLKAEGKEYIGDVLERRNARFSTVGKNLVAIHNIGEPQLRSAIKLGGLAMPSIAITKADIGHEDFGDISLLFSKDTINPGNRNNVIYDRDAWTPTFPEIQKKLSEKVVDSIYQKIKGLVPMKDRIGSVELDEANMKDNLGRRDWDAVSAYSDNSVMKQAYLAEQGKTIKVPMKQKTYGNDYNIEMLQQIIDIANETGIDLRNSDVYFNADTNPEYKSIVERIKGIVIEDKLKRYADVIAKEPKMEELLRKNTDMSFSRFDFLTGAAMTMKKDMELNDGKIPQVPDEPAAKALLDKKVPSTDRKYREWLEGLFNGVVEKEGIRNERDIFTPSGSRRSFEQTHDPVTLHNVVAKMLREAERGGQGFFSSNIFGASANRMNSLDEVRTQSDRLVKMDEDEMKVLQEEMTNELAELSSHVTRDDVGEIMDFRQDLIEAVSKSHNADGIYKELHKFYKKFTKEDAEHVEDIVKRIGQMPAEYFEAKPRRAVPLNEIKAAVLPKNTGKDIVDALKQNGTQVSLYDPKKEGHRATVTARAIKAADVRFSVSDNIERGVAALNKLAKGDEVVRNAMDREELLQYGGTSGISFYFGEPGDPGKNYRKGYGISHIASKHGVGALMNAIKAVAVEPVKRFVEGNKTVILGNDDYEAVLALTKDGNEESWLLSGWNIKENAGETGEVSTQTSSTQTNPTFSREDLGAALADAKVMSILELPKDNSENSHLVVTPEQDAEYMEAVNSGDMKKAQQMVDEVAKTVGYKQGSQYQGGSAFNGVAPTGHEYYSTPEESLKAWENGEYEGSWSIADEFVRGIEMGDLSNRITAKEYARGNRAQKESIQALRYVREKIQNGDKNPTVKVYRSVPKGIKEGSFRNGDWVTLSKSYAIENAEIHSGSQYYGKDGMADWDNDGYNIIEMEVPIEELWWDGNDINEFGYDDGKEYRYKNTSNNRKLNEPVTYDDNGNVIPLSQRFQEENNDIRFSTAYHGTGADFEKFDNSHIGEGEGAQAHGYGAYVTFDKETGEGYARKLANRDVVYDGLETYSSIIHQAEYVINTQYKGNVARAIKQERISYALLPTPTSEFIMNSDESDWKVNEGPRILYTVQIPEDNGSNYLDEQKAIGEELRDRIAGILKDEGFKETNRREDIIEMSKDDKKSVIRSRQSGGDLYAELSDALGGDKQASEFLSENGFVGIKYDGRIDGPCAVIFDADDIEITEHIRFSTANNNQRIFISNAEAAVGRVKQDKATADQWLAMLTKEGGLKAGEDKWLGLSDWLKTQKTQASLGLRDKAVTKQELQDYIAKNAIQIEEARYSDAWDTNGAVEQTINNEYGEGAYDLLSFEPGMFDDVEVIINGNDFKTLYERLHPGETIEVGEYGELDEDGEELRDDFINDVQNLIGSVNSINGARLDYTTQGLDNKREIALTVPTIEPWNEDDEVHFGDAGEGRAVAWIRFGEAFDADDNYTLVIDEIQSKRHQEGREKGYINADTERITREKEEALQTKMQFEDRMAEKYGIKNHGRLNDYELSSKIFEKATEDESAQYGELISAANSTLDDYRKNAKGAVPGAPFEKNWHELAMKRMLRLAAEEGYDKVAWTNGKMQSDRYNLGKVLDKVTKDSYDTDDDHTMFVMDFTNEKQETVIVNNASGNITNGLGEGRTLSDLVGKSIAEKMMALPEDKPTNVGSFEVGGEGMNGFYDKILVDFMNKYGKKWGVKVKDISLPGLQNKDGWHSIDVTPEMKESVMQGQPMFSTVSKDVTMNDWEAEEAAVRFSKVTDQALLDKLNSEPTIKVYRAMQMIDGKLYPPMSAYVGGELREPSEIGQWEQSVEDTDPTHFDKTGKYVLDKRGSSKGKIGAAYNPYFHTSNTMLNDQFSSAWDRPELVVVETEIPESELTSGYRAKGAKNAVGEAEWKAGPVAGKLKDDKARKVYLSRWAKPVRVVPAEEAAKAIAHVLEGTGVGVPFNTVNAELREALVKEGVTITAPQKGNAGDSSRMAYKEWADGNNIRFSLSLPEKRREGESAVDYETRVYRHMLDNYRPIVNTFIIPDDADKKAVGTITGFSGNDLEELYKSIEEDRKGTGDAAYIHESNVIILRATGEGYTRRRLAEMFFHENGHAFIDELRKQPTMGKDRFDRLLSSLADSGVAYMKDSHGTDNLNEFISKLHEVYAEEDSNEETFVYALGEAIAKDRTEELKRHAPGYAKTLIDNLLTQLGYESEKRTSHGGTDEDSEFGRGTGEDGRGGGQEGLTSDAEQSQQSADTVIGGTLHEYEVTKLLNDVETRGLQAMAGAGAVRSLWNSVYRNMGESRKKITELAFNRYGFNTARATEAYLTDEVENFKDLDSEAKERWSGIRDRLQDLLGTEMSVADAMWTVYTDQHRRDNDLLSDARRAQLAHELGYALPSEKARDTKLSQDQDDEVELMRFSTMADGIAEAYNMAAGDIWLRHDEIARDQYASVNALVDAYEKGTGVETQTFEDVRMALNQRSSKGCAMLNKWINRQWNPMMDAVRDVMKEARCSVKDVERYVMLKHILERNVVLAARDARDYWEKEMKSNIKDIENYNNLSDEQKNELIQKINGQTIYASLSDRQKQVLIQNEKAKLEKHKRDIEAGTDSQFKANRKKDYGGIIGMYTDFSAVRPYDERKESREQYEQRLLDEGKKRFTNVAKAEQEAQKEVNIFEGNAGRVEIINLWAHINSANKATLHEQYKSGMLTREQYERARDMFEYYVPLRGFAQDTPVDLYDYYSKASGNHFQPVLKQARGRKTMADNPFGYIGSMASSGILAAVKNESKQAFYYFISNRRDRSGLVQITDTWYKARTDADGNVETDDDGKPVFEAVYPPFTEALSEQGARDAYDKWESDMEKLSDQGLAFHGITELRKKHLSYTVMTGEAEKQSHVVRIMVAGEEKVMFINGNPRAAQAINGDLNMESNQTEVGKFFSSALRGFAQLNTGLNPEFWISNLQRDMIFSFISVSVGEDKDYREKFRSIRWTEAPKVLKMKRDYDNGVLGHSKTEEYYREFVENGGVTGYTSLISNDKWEAMMEDFTDEEKHDLNLVRTTLDGINEFGEAVEQMTRFTAYMASRESGRDIIQSVADAKEITVNFNRKGSGKAMTYQEALRLVTHGNKPERGDKTRAVMHMLLSSVSYYGRRAIMFWNASVQGLNAGYRLFKKNPKKMGAWMGTLVASGALMAILNGLTDGLGGDDDDEYLDIPDYERRNNVLLGYKGHYLKVALPQEMRVFYAIGDIIVTHLMKRAPQKDFLGEVASAIGALAPVEPSEGLQAFMPSLLTPIVEYATNKDFMGSKVYNDRKFMDKVSLENAPKWATPLPNTNSFYTDLAKALSDFTGGDKYEGGWLNMDPNVIEHFLEGYTGGLGTTINKTLGFVRNTMDGEFHANQTPIVRRLYVDNDDRYRNSYVTSLWYYYNDMASNCKRIMKQAEKAGDKEKFEEMKNTLAYEIMKVIEQHQNELKPLDEQLKLETKDSERRSIMHSQDSIRRVIIKEISNIGKE